MKNRNIGKILLPLFSDAIIMALVYFGGAFILNKFGNYVGEGFWGIIPFLIIIKIFIHGIFGFYFDFNYGLIFQLFGAAAGNIIVYFATRFFFNVHASIILHIIALVIDIGFVFLLRFVISRPTEGDEDELYEEEYEDDEDYEDEEYYEEDEYYEEEEKDYAPVTAEESFDSLDELPEDDLLLDLEDDNFANDFSSQEDDLFNEPITPTFDNTPNRDYELETKTAQRLRDLEKLESQIQQKENEFAKMQQQFMLEKQRKQQEYSRIAAQAAAAQMNSANFAPSPPEAAPIASPEPIIEEVETPIDREQRRLDTFIRDLEDLQESLSSRAELIKEQEYSMMLKLHEITEKESYLDDVSTMYRNRPSISDDELIRRTEEKISKRKKQKVNPYYHPEQNNSYSSLRRSYNPNKELAEAMNRIYQISDSINNESQLEPFIKGAAKKQRAFENTPELPKEPSVPEPEPEPKKPVSDKLNEDALQSQIRVARQRTPDPRPSLTTMHSAGNVNISITQPEPKIEKQEAPVYAKPEFSEAVHKPAAYAFEISERTAGETENNKLTPEHIDPVPKPSKPKKKKKKAGAKKGVTSTPAKQKAPKAKSQNKTNKQAASKQKPPKKHDLPAGIAPEKTQEPIWQDNPAFSETPTGLPDLDLFNVASTAEVTPPVKTAPPKEETQNAVIKEEILPDFGFTPSAVSDDVVHEEKEEVASDFLAGIKLVHEPNESVFESSKKKDSNKSKKDKLNMSDLSDFINSLD